MGLAEDLRAEAYKLLKEEWSIAESREVPETKDIELGNRGRQLEATCLYADLADSTNLVNTLDAKIVGGVYKCYLNCACRIIVKQQGIITAFDGDRVMAIFHGDRSNDRAVAAALAIDHAVVRIINPALKDCYKEKTGDYVVRHSVGIDRSRLLAVRTGIRGSNDLVWIGRAANYAAKLAAIRDGDNAVWITANVHDSLSNALKTTPDGWKSIWAERTWKAQGGQKLYCSCHPREL